MPGREDGRDTQLDRDGVLTVRPKAFAPDGGVR
jgi:hypothetical protein